MSSKPPVVALSSTLSTAYPEYTYLGAVRKMLQRDAAPKEICGALEKLGLDFISEFITNCAAFERFVPEEWRFSCSHKRLDDGVDRYELRICGVDDGPSHLATCVLSSGSAIVDVVHALHLEENLAAVYLLGMSRYMSAFPIEILNESTDFHLDGKLVDDGLDSLLEEMAHHAKPPAVDLVYSRSAAKTAADIEFFDRLSDCANLPAPLVNYVAMYVSLSFLAEEFDSSELDDVEDALGALDWRFAAQVWSSYNMIEQVLHFDFSPDEISRMAPQHGGARA
jgi:hypothetical protein